MSREMIIIFIVAFLLLVIQSIGGYYQICDYKKAIRRVHQYGNVGIGQKRGRVLSGNLVLIACDQCGVITRIEVMEGLSFLTRFKMKEKLLEKLAAGESIYDYLQMFYQMERKKQKGFKGYIQALEALELRLQDKGAEVA